MSLEALRSEIDALDDQLLELLRRRTEVVAALREEKAKAGVFAHDPERERAVLERLLAKGAGRFPKEALGRIWREVMSASVAVQAQVSVSYLGPQGTWSHQAARHLFGLSARYVEAATLEGVLDAVRLGGCTYGVAPLENSTEGSVSGTLDALLEGGVQLRGELVLPIAHCLLGAGEGLTAVERVYSHPQALAQCRDWLRKNLPQAQLIQTPSTAAAAREASGDPAAAAIGSALCAELYGVPVLREHIQDRPENATRFVTLARTDGPRTGADKTTLAFALADEAHGTLRRALELFDEAGVNLTHIESRPSRASAWAYVFVVTLDGHREDPQVAKLLQALAARCADLRLLGSYPRAAP
jgi:chorismate mutase/prephenate dehydratase